MGKPFDAVAGRSIRTAAGKAESRTKLIAAVRAAARRLGIEEDDRRELQQQITGHRSMADMSLADLGKMLDHLNKGWHGQTGGRATTSKIRALWWTLYWLGAVDDPNDRAIDAFVRRQGGPASLRFTDHRAAQPIIEALKSWAHREGVRWPSDADLRTMREGNPTLTLPLYERHAVLAAIGAKLADRGGLHALAAVPYAQAALGLSANHLAWSAHELDAAIKLLGKKHRRLLDPRGGEA
jgi:phage gp16-like protein